MFSMILFRSGRADLAELLERLPERYLRQRLEDDRYCVIDEHGHGWLTFDPEIVGCYGDAELETICGMLTEPTPFLVESSGLVWLKRLLCELVSEERCIVDDDLTEPVMSDDFVQLVREESATIDQRSVMLRVKEAGEFAASLRDERLRTFVNLGLTTALMKDELSSAPHEGFDLLYFCQVLQSMFQRQQEVL